MIIKIKPADFHYERGTDGRQVNDERLLRVRELRCFHAFPLLSQLRKNLAENSNQKRGRF